MRLKTFYANTMTDAMQMIRDSMGDEAIIVDTGDDRARGGVRVTAAMDPAFEIGDDGVAEENNWLQYDDEQDTDAVAEELTEIMLRHCVPEDIMDHMISCTTVMGYDDVSTALVESLEQLFSFRPLPAKAHNQPIIMVGPPGAGKTLAVAKLTARSVMNGLNVGVISTDTVRAGGIEQLGAFTKLLKVNLRKAASPQDLHYAIKDMKASKDQVIIDTRGINPFDKEDVREIAKLIGVSEGRAVFVLPAGIDADEAGEMARVFATIGATDILPTRVDMARRLGNLLSAAHQGGLCFADVSDTPKVAQGLSPLSPHALAKLLTPRLYKVEKSSILSTQAVSQDYHESQKTRVRQ